MIEQMVAFLTARLAEDEAVAGRAAPGPWFRDSHAAFLHGIKDANGRGLILEGLMESVNVTYVVLNAPDRALRRATATRRLLHRYDQALKAQNPGSLVGYTRAVDHGYIEAHEEAIRDAVNVYAGHPDYRTEWKPCAD